MRAQKRDEIFDEAHLGLRNVRDRIDDLYIIAGDAHKEIEDLREWLRFLHSFAQDHPAWPGDPGEEQVAEKIQVYLEKN